LPVSPFAPVQFGKYTLVERIASGGMAEVYRAVLRGAAGFEKTVALKRILPIFNEERDFIALFQDEARTASTLTHANLVQTFDFGEEGGSYYLALELVEGADLARLCERLREAGQPFPTATAAFVVAEAARGLAYAHDKRGADGTSLGIVHRDVSPQNILVSYAGEVKIADFGIAKAARKVHRTMTGMVMGKLKYMSPEQVAGDNLDGRSDIFSLGVILYELLTGGTLFPEAGSAVAELIHMAPIPPPSARAPSVPAELDAIVMKALGRPREKRYARAGDLARDLSVWLNHSSPGFTREDLGALVARIYPLPGQSHARTGTVLGSGVSGLSPARKPQATIVTGDEPRAAAPATSAMRKKPSTTPPPEVFGSFEAGPGPASRTPSGNRTIANPADPDVDPRAQTEMRQLDIPTRTRLPDDGGTGATMTQTDAEFALPPPTRQAPAFDPAPPRLQSRTEPALRRKKGPSVATLVILALVAIILGSGALVLLRFVLPGRESQATTTAVDAGAATAMDAGGGTAALGPTDAGVALDAATALAPALPFQLAPTLTDEKQRDVLAKKIGDRRASRGVHDADYELFLAALDYRVATLTIDAATGRAESSASLPMSLQVSIASRQLGDTLDQVMDYLRRTGELPPAVRAAAKKYLHGKRSWDPEHGIQIATLAVWLDDEDHAGRLAELARQNDGLGRWCSDRLPATRRRFAALACEPAALAAELRAAGDDATAQAIDTWQSTPTRAMRSPWTVEYLTAQWGAPSVAGREIRVQAKVSGGARPPASAFTLLAGGTNGPIAASAGGEQLASGDGVDAGATPGESLPPLVFTLPPGAFAPVLRVELPGGALSVRVATPPR
jgi:serine/threonine protein kinase